MAIAFSRATTQDIIQQLEAAYKQAKLNGLPEVAAQHYATGGMHDLLTVINRRWQDHKDTERMNSPSALGELEGDDDGEPAEEHCSSSTSHTIAVSEGMADYDRS